MVTIQPLQLNASLTLGQSAYAEFRGSPGPLRREVSRMNLGAEMAALWRMVSSHLKCRRVLVDALRRVQASFQVKAFVSSLVSVLATEILHECV